MKLITLEEHMSTLESHQEITKFVAQHSDMTPAEAKLLGESFTTGLVAYSANSDDLYNVTDLRLHYMDEQGIDKQILSYCDSGATPAALPNSDSLRVCQEVNEFIAKSVQDHPDRFDGLATLPMNNPEAAAKELERSVNQLGLKGALILGTVNGEFLDAPRFRPIFEKAAELDVPLYLHPSLPTGAVSKQYFSGLNPAGLNAVMSGPAWGWHQEAGLHMIRLIFSGLFDEYPNLHIISGHWGEMVPNFLERLDEATDPVIYPAKTLKKSFSEYYRNNVFITPSGMFTWPQFQLSLTQVSADHILWAQDFPYIKGNETRHFLENAPIAPSDREKIANQNATKLLHL